MLDFSPPSSFKLFFEVIIILHSPMLEPAFLSRSLKYGLFFLLNNKVFKRRVKIFHPLFLFYRRVLTHYLHNFFTLHHGSSRLKKVCKSLSQFKKTLSRRNNVTLQVVPLQGVTKFYIIF
jgi:hypothetical protein